MPRLFRFVSAPRSCVILPVSISDFGLKVGDGLAFAFVQLRLNLVREHRAGPAVFDGFVGLPEADGGSLQLGQEQAIMSPRQFRNGRGRSRCGQFSHSL